ncbi:MAG: hypothetical protein P8Z49_03470 [Acidobacteriota bacterium]
MQRSGTWKILAAAAFIILLIVLFIQMWLSSQETKEAARPNVNVQKIQQKMKKIQSNEENQLKKVRREIDGQNDSGQ